VEGDPYIGVEVSKGSLDSAKEVSLEEEENFLALSATSKQENQCFLMRTSILKKVSWKICLT